MLPYYILRRRLDYISYLVSYINILILRRYILSTYLLLSHLLFVLSNFLSLLFMALIILLFSFH